MRIYDLRTNHLNNPLGYKLNKVSFSWKVEEAKGNATQSVQVIVALDESFTKVIYNSGREEQISSLDFTPILDLQEKTRYYWKVFVTDDAGDIGESETAFFETAIFYFKEPWIKAPFTEHPLFLKYFHLPEKAVRARLYICGLGLYEAYLNGKKVSGEYLAPFYNDYNYWIQYQTYDVTEQLTSGRNNIKVLLGNGWYKGRFGFIEDLDQLYGDTMQLTCLLEVTLEDGQMVQLSTDDTWDCMPSPILESSIYNGEVLDGRVTADGKAQKAVCTDGPSDILQPRLSVPVTIKERIKPVKIIRTPAGETVIDFGQNMSGWVEFTCREARNKEILLQYGELLQNGCFYNENLRSAKAEFRYISDGKETRVRPHFTFYGFRYVKVEGSSEVLREDFDACVIYSDMENKGSITTSNKKVNQLFSNTMWGQKSNFLDTPTDCPQRDERMGWTGDAQVFAKTASYNMDTAAFFTKFLYDMRLEQRVLNGSVPHVVPDILGQIRDIINQRATGNSSVDQPHGSCAWGDAATIIPWTLYQFYGDKVLLKDQYDNMKMWTDYIRSIDEIKCNSKHLWTAGFHFADWLALDNFHEDSSFGGTDCYYIASAFYLHSAELTAKAAQALGYETDALKYEKLACEIREAMQKEYFTETGRIAVDTQTAMVVALKFNIVMDKHRSRLIADLKKKLDEEDIHLTTGFVGTPYLCPILTENGLNEYAYTLLLNEDFPSWLYEINMGATTIWERWNSVLPNGLVSDTGMNSMNHYAYGSIVEWMYAYMCGLKPQDKDAGFHSYIIAPHPDRRIRWTKMKFHSPYGLIVSEWEYNPDGIEYFLKVPFDTTAEFVLPEPKLPATINGREAKELCETGRIKLTKGEYMIQVWKNEK